MKVTCVGLGPRSGAAHNREFAFALQADLMCISKYPVCLYSSNLLLEEGFYAPLLGMGLCKVRFIGLSHIDTFELAFP